MQILPILHYNHYSALKYFSLIGVLGYLFIGALPAQAFAEEVNLSIQPAMLQIRAKPPTDIRAPFTIKNHTTNTMTLTVQLNDLKNDHAGKLTFLPDTQATKIAPGILRGAEILDKDTPVTKLQLGPKQQKELILHLSISQEAPLVDHTFAVTFLTESTNAPQTEGTTSIIQAGIALPVLLASEKEQRADIGIVEFSTPAFREMGPVPFTLRLKNHGKHFEIAQGEIFIKNMFGQTVGKIVLPQTTILAQTTYEIPEIFWSEKLLIGFYSASLTLASANGEPLLNKTVYFFGIPIKQLVSLIVFVFLFLIIFFRIKTLLAKK